MMKLSSIGRVASFAAIVLSASISASASQAATAGCKNAISHSVPNRKLGAAGGSEVMQQVLNISGPERDAVIERQILSGNMPAFQRRLTPVTLSGKGADGKITDITICVTPEYLSVGSDADFVRVPLGLPAAARIADNLGFFLPTPRMVDAIYQQAEVHLAPSPMAPTRQMSSTDYLVRHNVTVEKARTRAARTPGSLTAGQKKDIVLTRRLLNAHGRVAIYGWHRTNGRPIQPLSTVHGAQYADYSHGVRLVAPTALVNGEPRPLAEVLADRDLAGIISSEGPIDNPDRLQASLYR